MQALTSKQRELLKELESFKLTTHLKRAAPDVKKTFESNFNMLVDSIMDEHFPRLKKYDLGFQLVEKSPDNTKAFGIRALRLRSLAFIPFFYNNGTVSGYDVIYIPKLNLFFPATEPWVVYLTSRSKEELGRPDESLKDHYQKLFPNLLPLRRPITFKSASVRKLLPDYLKKYAVVGKRLYALIDKAPWLIEKLAHFYGSDILNLVKESAYREVPAPRFIRNVSSIEKSAKLRIYHEFQDPDTYTDLSISEREQLFKRGYFIKDAREEEVVSTALPVLRRDVFFEIDSPGVYEVVDSDFNTHLATAYYVDNVLTITIHDTKPPLTFKLRKLNNKDWYSANDQKIYAIRKVSEFSDSPIITKLNASDIDATTRSEPILDYPRSGPILDYRGIGVTIHPVNDSILVTNASKKIQTVSYPKNRHDTRRTVILPSICYQLKYKDSETEVIDLNNPSKTERKKFRFLSPHVLDNPNTQLTTIKLSYDAQNNRYFLNNTSGSKFDIITTLVRDFNLREKTASQIIRDAELNKITKYWIKSADTDYIRNSDRPAPQFIEAPRGEWAPGYPFESKLEADLWVPGLKRPQPIVNILEPPPLKIIQKIKQLADSNDGEAFDLGLINSLLYTTNIDDYIPQIIRGIDAMCRILFVLYKHQDETKERYGNEDYKKIVESLKSSIENVGDLVIDLSQQKIDPYINSLESETEPLEA